MTQTVIKIGDLNDKRALYCSRLFATRREDRNNGSARLERYILCTLF